MTMTTSSKKRPAGTLTAGGALARIIEAKALRLERARAAAPLEEIVARCEASASTRIIRSLQADDRSSD